MPVEAAALGDLDHCSVLAPLNRSWLRAVHLQPLVTPPAVIMRKVRGQDPPQLALVQDHDVVEALAADAPDQALDVRGLPGTARGAQHFLDAHGRHSFAKGAPP